jgi:hypothetical protein
LISAVGHLEKDGSGIFIKKHLEKKNKLRQLKWGCVKKKFESTSKKIAFVNPYPIKSPNILI